MIPNNKEVLCFVVCHTLVSYSAFLQDVNARRESHSGEIDAKMPPNIHAIMVERVKVSGATLHLQHPLLPLHPKTRCYDLFMVSRRISLIALIATTLMMPPAVSAQGYFLNGQCAIVVASRQTIDDARAWIIANRWEDEARVYASRNGWYAVSVAVVDTSVAPAVLERGKSNGVLPSDAYCSTGKSYLREVEWTADQERYSRPPPSSLWADFDARPFSLAEKRYLQAALALEGYYTGLIDGAWGRGSQDALERFTRAEFDREPSNVDAAYLLNTTVDSFADDGWQEQEVSYLAISVLLPMEKMRITEKVGLWEQWSHSEKDVRVTFNDLTELDLVNVHRDHANRSDRTGEPYTVRQPDRWVTSVKNNWGTIYIRSDLIDGTWSTVAVYAANEHRAELGLISSGIKVGRPSSIVPESDGLLVSYASELAAAIADDEASKQRTEGSSRVGVSQPPQDDRRDETQANSSGTGFFVNSEGAMLTNAHVVDGCRAVTVDGQPADIVTVSQAFDLAVVKPRNVEDILPLYFARTEVGLNADITIAGYPLHGLLGGLNVSRGSISAMKGLGGDETSVQISAPVQPGNSGGPVIDRSGNIVGVVVSKLDVMLLADATGDIAQNVNFAIRGSMAKIFLQTNGISFEERDSAEVMLPEQAAITLQGATRLIQCVSD